MRLSPHRPLTLVALVAAAALAVAQPPPPPPNGGANPPPLKQNQPPPGDGDRRNRPRAAAGQLPMMDGIDMPEIVPVTEEPVTASGDIDLWRARIAARRAKEQPASASPGSAPR